MNLSKTVFEIAESFINTLLNEIMRTISFYMSTATETKIQSWI